MKKFILCFAFIVSSMFSAHATTSFIADWFMLTGNAQYSPRQGCTMVSFLNKFWTIGGLDGTYSNSVWYSSNLVQWFEIYPPLISWVGRYEHATVVFDSKLWVLGGFGGGVKTDVWYTADGLTWTQATTDAGFQSGIIDAVVFDNKIWVIDAYDIAPNACNNVWSSTNGVDWVLVTGNAAFEPVYDAEAIVFNSKMWVIGGRRTNATNHCYYSTDGIDWIAATLNAEFPARSEFALAEYKNRLWLTGGDGNPYVTDYFADIWSSADGIVWEEDTALPFVGRFNPNLVSFNNTLLFYANGQAAGVPTVGRKNDIWIGRRVVFTPTFTPTPTFTCTVTVTVSPTITVTPTVTPRAIHHHNVKDSDHGEVTIDTIDGKYAISISNAQPYFVQDYGVKASRDYVHSGTYLICAQKTPGVIVLQVINRDGTERDCRFDPAIVRYNIWKRP